MKWTKKTWAFFGLQLICFLVIPCILIWLQYGDAELGAKYKISVTGIIVLAFVFMLVKKIMLNPFLKKIDGQISQIEINQLSVVDHAAIYSLKKKYRALSVMQLVFNAIIPILMLVLFIMTLKVVEAGIIKLFGVLVFCAISIGLGVIFKVFEVYSLKCEHEATHEE